MGLGKTLQALTAVAMCHHEHQEQLEPGVEEHLRESPGGSRCLGERRPLVTLRKRSSVGGGFCVWAPARVFPGPDPAAGPLRHTRTNDTSRGVALCGGFRLGRPGCCAEQLAP